MNIFGANLEPDQRNAFILAGAMMFISGFLAVILPTGNVLKTASGVYAILAAMTFVVFGLSVFQETLVGVKLENLGMQSLLGLGLAAVFLLIKVIVPAFSVGASTIAIITLFFAPIIEETIFRGGLLAFIEYAEAKGEEVPITSFKFWIANLIQAFLFATLHLYAYVNNWYNLSGSALAVSIAAESSAFIAALTFGLAAGALDSHPKVRSLIPSIIAHLVINTVFFITLSVVGVPF